MWLNRWLAKRDAFGFKIQMNYRKKNRYGTALGGCCTVCVMLLVLATTLALCLQLVFIPDYHSDTYMAYKNPTKLQPWDSEGRASLAVMLEDFHSPED